MNKQHSHTIANKGFVQIGTAMMFALIVITLSTTTILASVSSLQSTASIESGENTLHLAEGCAEDALLRLGNNSAYTGGIINTPQGTCQVTVSSNAGIWTITVSHTNTRTTRSLQLQVTRNSSGTYRIVQWWEI